LSVKPDSAVQFSVGAILWMFLSCTIAGAAAEPLTLYVSPDGNDNFSGTLARANRRRTDGPLLTVTRARDVVRAMVRGPGGKPRGPITVCLRGGTYFLPQPLVLTPEDSGTAEAPITYTAYPNERAVISAGRSIRGWAKVNVNGRDLWAAAVPQFRETEDCFREMWVSGQRRVLARSPNVDFLRVAEAPGGDRPVQPQGPSRFHFRGDDLRNWPDVTRAEVVVMSLWAESHLPIASVDEKERLVQFTKSAVQKISPDDKYWVEGAMELLDEPGEWYFDRKSGTVYYMPKAGETMIGSEFIIPWYTHVLHLQGSPEAGLFVEHVTFRGITFANSEWNIPRVPPPGKEARGGFDQAAIGVPGAVWGEGVRYCRFDGCTIAHAGNYGIELAGGCQHNKISYCTLTDLGAGGIKLGEGQIHLAESEQTKFNEISDCTISDCGKRYPSAVGIWLGQTSQNSITHNDVHGLWYTGISIGWTWGYGDALAGNNVIEFNHVHHIGTPAAGVEPILSDMGAIYTLGNQPGTVIRGNVFHDIAGLKYGGWGIYFDEGSTGIAAENNLVYRTTHGGLHQHYGAANVVRNNIFAFGRDDQIQRSRVEDHLSFTFEKNLVYWDHGALLTGNWSKLNVAFDNNTYWQIGGDKFDLAGRTWQQWRDAGMDRHSRIADPGFVDAEHDDFHLRPGGDQGLTGFVPFDVSGVGPRLRGQGTVR